MAVKRPVVCGALRGLFLNVPNQLLLSETHLRLVLKPRAVKRDTTGERQPSPLSSGVCGEKSLILYYMRTSCGHR